jgi:hypothetical protein
MDVVDNRVSRYMGTLFRGNEIAISGKMRKSVAAWAVKTAITTRFAHINPDPVEREWPKQLKRDRLPSPEWTVWMARFIGSTDFWFRQGSVNIEKAVRLYPAPDQPATSPPLSKDGVVLTIVMGQLCVQVLRLNRAARAVTADNPATIQIWPSGPYENWPPPKHIDDSTLEVFASRFYSGDAPIIMQVPREVTDQSPGPRPNIFMSSPITEEALDKPATFTFNHICGVCNASFPVPYDTGKRLRELPLPFRASYTFVCPECGDSGGGEFELQELPHPS